MQDTINQFKDAMRQRGIIPPASPVADGEIQRCEVQNGRKGNKDGAYKLFLDATPAGGFQNHKDALGWQNWRYEGETPTLSPEERAAKKQQIEAAKAKREAQKLADYEAVAAQLQDYWQSLPESGVSAYLQCKQVKPYGVRFDGEAVIVPVCDISGKLWSVQTILSNGRKSFHKGGRITGGFHRIGNFDHPKVILIAEGYATAASAYLATHYPAVVAFNAGNLLPVAKQMRAAFPNASIVILADDDKWPKQDKPPSHTGEKSAKEAASAVKGQWVLPEFSDTVKKEQPTDFNDLHCLQGLEEVKRQINAVTVRPSYRTSYRASELQYMEFPPVKYVVKGYIVEGLSLLVGRPKLGKSWKCLDIALAVASGGNAFGSIACEQGDVLYLALEDNPRRLQSRLRLMMRQGYQKWPESLQIETEWPDMSNGCVEKVQEWIDQAEKPRLVIIDTLAKVRSERKQNDSLYDSDYKTVAALQSIASINGVAVIVVHHTRKMEADDPIEKVSGSMGLTGAADSILVLDRKAEGVTLYGRGRDIEEIETAMQFDKEHFIWRILGDACILERTPQRQGVIDVLEETGDVMSPKEIADKMGESSQNIRQLVSKMAEKGEIMKVSRGKYSAIYPHHNDHIDHNEEEDSEESDYVTDNSSKAGNKYDE
jgi:phage/plasmid primase-like uncharacterized protein